MYRLFGLILTLLVITCGGCTASQSAADGQPAPQITIFAAASLTEAFEVIGARFTQTEHVTVDFNFAGSQQLAQQLSSGAPGDVFAAANQRQLDVAVASGRVVAGSEAPFASNQLVIVTPVDNPASLYQLHDLAQPGVKLVLADAAVPAGQYALTLLDNARAAPEFGPAFADAVLTNVVSYEESVRAVLAKVLLGEADAGIVYLSDVTGPVRQDVALVTLPAALNVTAHYVIAPIADSAHPDVAQAFVDFVRSDAGRTILEAYGLRRVSP